MRFASSFFQREYLLTSSGSSRLTRHFLRFKRMVRYLIVQNQTFLSLKNWINLFKTRAAAILVIVVTNPRNSDSKICKLLVLSPKICPSIWTSENQDTVEETDPKLILPGHGYFPETTLWKGEGRSMSILKRKCQESLYSPSSSLVVFHFPRIGSPHAIPW